MVAKGKFPGITRKKHSAYYRRDLASYLFLIGPPFFILLLLTVAPIAYSLWLSLSDLNYSMPGTGQFIGFQNFVKMVTEDPFFWVIMKNTFIQVFFTVSLQMIIGMILALLFSRETRGMKMARALLMVPIMITPVVVGVIWRLMVSPDFGIINYLLSLLGLPGPNWLGSPGLAMTIIIVSDIWLSTPFVAIILVAGIASLSKEVFEAAMIDGAGAVRTFRCVTLPLLRPVIFVALMFRLIDAFKRFDSVYIMTAGGPGNATEIINIYAYRMGFSFMDIGYASAVIVFLFMIILICIAVISRKMNATENY